MAETRAHSPFLLSGRSGLGHWSKVNCWADDNCLKSIDFPEFAPLLTWSFISLYQFFFSVHYYSLISQQAHKTWVYYVKLHWCDSTELILFWTYGSKSKKLGQNLCGFHFTFILAVLMGADLLLSKTKFSLMTTRIAVPYISVFFYLKLYFPWQCHKILPY